MKKTLPYIIFLSVLCVFTNAKSDAQISVVSTTGYTVNIVVQPVAIVPTSGSCQWGYNYNVRINYNVTITGTNAPSSLYTLQGTIGCGSSSHFFDIPNGNSNGTVTSQSNVWRSTSDCSTATVSSLNCNLVTIEISGLGISNRNVSFTVSAIPLPVLWNEFTATAETSSVKLNWSTVTEINNEYFSVERSADGSTWNEINRVKGAGNSSDRIAYQVVDQNPLSGNAYYRIKQVDIDGKATYSETRQVKFNGIVKNSISVYPVPNTGNTISFRGITEPANMVMTIRDAAGAAVYNTTLSASSVQVPAIPAGYYVISLHNKISGEVTNLRYIKM